MTVQSGQGKAKTQVENDQIALDEVKKIFDRSRYIGCEQFRFSQWAHALSLRKLIANRLDQGEPGLKVLPAVKIIMKLPFTGSTSVHLNPVIELNDIVLACLGEQVVNLGKSNINPDTDIFPSKALLISLSAPKSEILISFSEWLDHILIEYDTRKVHKNEKLEWAKYNLLGYIDLHLWQRCRGISMTETTLINLLAPAEADGEEFDVANNKRSLKNSMKKYFTSNEIFKLMHTPG